MTGEQDNIIALNSETIKNPDNVKMLIDFLVSQAQVLTLSPDQAYYLPKDDTKHNINGKQFYFEEDIAFVPKKNPWAHPNEINIITLGETFKGKEGSTFAKRATKITVNTNDEIIINKKPKPNKKDKGYKVLITDEEQDIHYLDVEAKINAKHHRGREAIINANPILHPSSKEVYLQQQNLVAGVPLDVFLKNDKIALTIQQKFRIAKNILTAIKNFHAQGSLHRDIKHENMMINPETLDIELIDFEFAEKIQTYHLPDEENNNFAVTGHYGYRCGTAAHMAPEIFQSIVNRKDYTFFNEKTEVFAAAPTLYFLFGGEKSCRDALAEGFHYLHDISDKNDQTKMLYLNKIVELAGLGVHARKAPINVKTLHIPNVSNKLQQEIRTLIATMSRLCPDNRYTIQQAIDYINNIELKQLPLAELEENITTAQNYISGTSRTRPNRDEVINCTFKKIFEIITKDAELYQTHLAAMNNLFSQDATVKGQFANWLKQKARIHNTDESSGHKAYMTSPLFHLFPIVSLRFISQIAPKINSHDYAKQYNTQLLAKKIVSRIDNFNHAILKLQTQQNKIIARHSNKASNKLKIQLLGKTIAELRAARNEFSETCLAQFNQPRTGQGEGLITHPLHKDNIDNAVTTCNQALQTCKQKMTTSIVNNILSNAETKKFNHSFVKYAKEALNIILCIPGLMKAGFKTALRATHVMKPVLKYDGASSKQYWATGQDFCMFATQNKTREESDLAAGEIDRIGALEFNARMVRVR